jgi:type IV pilus assembly protein PilC
MASIDLSKYQARPATKIETASAVDGNAISGILNKEITFLEKKFGPKEKEGFYSELGLLLSTGVDIKTAFEIIEEDIPNKKHKALLEQIKNDIIGGRRIYEAISKHAKIFSQYEAQSIKIGEETGKLSDVLKELGAFLFIKH